MCVVSNVTGYFEERLPPASDYWTISTITQFQQILELLKKLDEKLDQPDCIDPKKDLYIKELELKLAQLEIAELKRQIADQENNSKKVNHYQQLADSVKQWVPKSSDPIRDKPWTPAEEENWPGDIRDLYKKYGITYTEL